jgi:Protein of unknown function (DUF3987)
VPTTKRHYKDWIAAYLSYTQHSEAPDQFHYWSAVAAIAGAIRRKASLDMGLFRWFPNFYLCFVAPPGVVSKSTTADIGMSLLRRVPGIRFGPNAVTWPALVTALSESREDYPRSDGTFEPMCAVTVVASELGTLLQAGDTAMINLLTDLWDGRDDPFKKMTKKDGEEIIENPWINLVGCTTPAWIAETFNSYFIGGGFASRTLFVYAEHKRQLVAYPAQRMDDGRRDEANRLAEDLEQISLLSGSFVLTPAAVEWGTQWYLRHNASDNPLRLDARFGGYFARKQTHLHKTAMVLSLARSNSLAITPSDLAAADKAISALEPNMLAVFGEMNKEKIAEQMATVLGFIRRRGQVSRQELYSEFMTSMGFATFTECLNGITGSGLVGLEQIGAEVFLRYNPKIERRLAR